MKYYITQAALFLAMAFMVLVAVYGMIASYLSQPPLHLGYLLVVGLSLISVALLGSAMGCLREDRREKKNSPQEWDPDGEN